MLVASAEPFPFPPEHHSSAGLWNRVLFLPTPCDRESHQSVILAYAQTYCLTLTWLPSHREDQSSQSTWIISLW